jgi:hypothetical protein
MAYWRRIFGLGVLLVAISLVVFVSLASAHEITDVTFGDQVVANIGMLQTTPTTTATVTTTDQVTDTTGTAEATPAATTEATSEVQGTTPVTATTDAAGVQATPDTTQQGTQQQSPGALPATGGEIGLPWITLALIVIGGLVLFGGLSLALNRRS